MKKIIFSLLFLIISFPVFSSDSVNCFVEQVVAGELDPHFGEGCVLVVRTQESRLLGLVNRDAECATDSSVAALEALRRTWISVDRSGLGRIKNKKDLKFLRNEINKRATYYEWDGVIGSELSVSSEKTEKLLSSGLVIVEKLGREMEKNEIGGNAAAIERYSKIQSDPRLSLRDVVRQLLYSKGGGEYLEEVSVEDIFENDNFEDNLEEAAFDLIPGQDQDSWTEFRGKLIDTLFDLGRDNDDARYVFLKGKLGGYNNYSTSFIAVHNRRTAELVVLIQGYSE
ncbi:MAG: hypothetical protein HYW85_01030 [Deltaproteobacteria bacterium]|nr:hypothetical protein [Deltaproteobacteria bacterium]MBI3017465.1 hypothetical protein [Deltaproteobacteria bacterium]